MHIYIYFVHNMTPDTVALLKIQIFTINISLQPKQNFMKFYTPDKHIVS